MTSHPALPARPPCSGAGLCAQVAELAAEVERQSRDGVLELTAADAALAGKLADDLAEAVGPAAGQARLPFVERLERLREALAALALGIARSHGRLAWCLARAGVLLAPVLQWRHPDSEQPQAFGTVVLPTPEELSDAEDAVRRLHAALTRTGAAAAGAQDGPRASADGPSTTGPEAVV
ncbi:hypothetical protein PUR71_06665 [Streptomyces sp. SP17BM10]|uniref:hypothetical protein n=1 Tax=Streptomyces sp. SP17BM10 TaxID=3002530 RepID=UPI002E79A611|nr:hypothetical protein [Streptomyces sp. SP17BM10]MEE1782604.1 hypothetical protein [Streptomyces sp. SP17BM10]